MTDNAALAKLRRINLILETRMPPVSQTQPELVFKKTTHDKYSGGVACSVQATADPRSRVEEMGGRWNGWAVEWVDGWVGLRVGFIKINDIYNNNVGKGGVRVYEAYGVK